MLVRRRDSITIWHLLISNIAEGLASRVQDSCIAIIVDAIIFNIAEHILSVYLNSVPQPNSRSSKSDISRIRLIIVYYSILTRKSFQKYLHVPLWWFRMLFVILYFHHQMICFYNLNVIEKGRDQAVHRLPNQRLRRTHGLQHRQEPPRRSRNFRHQLAQGLGLEQHQKSLELRLLTRGRWAIDSHWTRSQDPAQETPRKVTQSHRHLRRSFWKFQQKSLRRVEVDPQKPRRWSPHPITHQKLHSLPKRGPQGLIDFDQGHGGGGVRSRRCGHQGRRRWRPPIRGWKRPVRLLQTHRRRG